MPFLLLTRFSATSAHAFESNAGDGALHPDADYAAAGARVEADRRKLLSDAEIVLMVRGPGADRNFPAADIGARMHWPAFGEASPHWSVDPLFGLERANYGKGKKAKGQSVIVYWYSADRDNRVPPNGNVPPTSGGDPHSDPRKDNAASDQVAHFLRTGQLIDVCAGAPCVTTTATRNN